MSVLLAALMWASLSTVALGDARAMWKPQDHDRKLLQQDTFPLTSVCMDQWPLPNDLNATEVQRFGNPCPGNFSYFACCNAADQCYVWSKSTDVLKCNSFLPNCCSHPSTNYTGRMFYPPRPGLTLKAKSVKWSKDLDAAPVAPPPRSYNPKRGYIIAACIGAAIVLAIAAAVIGAVLWVRRRIKAQVEAAASEAPRKPSAYAPAIPQPWSAHTGQGIGIPEPSGLYLTHSTEPMLPGLGSPGLSRACSTDPMLHHLGGPVSSLTSARSLDMKLLVRPGRAQAATGAGQELGSASLGAPGLYQTHSAVPMLPGRTSSDMSRMYSAELLMSAASSSGVSSSSGRSADAMLPRKARGRPSTGSSRPPNGSQAYRPPLPFASLDDLTYKACYRIT